MKRIFLGAAAVAAIFGGFAAHPVLADDISPDSTSSGIVPQVQDKAIETVNQAAANIPQPGGWQTRHVCLSLDAVNHYWCVFVPFPN